jgi:hypothetical protein
MRWKRISLSKIFKDESTPKTLKKRKPRSDVLSLPKQHRGHRGTQSIVNQFFKLCES